MVNKMIMKNKNRYFLNIGIIFFLSTLFIQCKDEILPDTDVEDIENRAVQITSDAEIDKGIDYQNGKFYIKGKDGKSINKARNGKESTLLTKTYTINIDRSGKYYLAAHILPVQLPSSLREDSDLQKVYVYINNEPIGYLNITKADWELAQIKDIERIDLNSGINTITFESVAPFYPDIDGLRIVSNYQDLMVENKKYHDYINYLKEKSTAGNSRSAFTDEDDWRVSPMEMETPEANYKHKEMVPVSCTYYKKMSLTKGNWTFETGPIQGDSYTSVDPVMYLYKIDDPHNYSFYNDDSNHFHSKIVANNIPSGDYYLVIRSKNSYNAQSYLGREGLVNVFCNGEVMNTNMPVSGYIVDVNSNYGFVNYFTAHTIGIPIIWLIENNGNKMKFRSSDYFFMDQMDFNWFDDARIRLDKRNNTTYQMLISAAGAMSFYFGNCDVYGSVGEAESYFFTTFPNYKRGDALSSANASYSYNAASWAGGLTNCWFWGGTLPENSTNYGSPSVWATWDDFFGNRPARYENAYTYSREYYGPSVIAVWSTNNDMSGVSNFSVTGDANGQAHGYAWETKAGAYGRVFHPLNALNGEKYGKVIAYYNKFQPDDVPYSRSKRTEMTFDQSVKAGLTVIEDVSLDDEQKRIVKSHIYLSRASSNLDMLYKNWSQKINSNEFVFNNNPYSFIETKEGKEFLSYAKSNLEESIPFLTEKIFTEKSCYTLEDNIIPYLFCTLLKDTHGSMIEEIKTEWKNHNRTAKGAYIAPLPIIFTKKYIKVILDRDFLHRTSGNK